jgi:hypothetical protein
MESSLEWRGLLREAKARYRDCCAIEEEEEEEEEEKEDFHRRKKVKMVLKKQDVNSNQMAQGMVQ